MRQHNITSAIPRTDQTDPAKFPPYEYQEFPKMLLGKDGKNIVNQQTLEPFVFQNEEELEEFLDANPVIAEEVRETSISPTQRLEMENETLRKLLAENERLTRENSKLRSVKTEEVAEDNDEEEAIEAAAGEEAPKRKKKRRNRDKPLRTLK